MTLGQKLSIKHLIVSTVTSAGFLFAPRIAMAIGTVISPAVSLAPGVLLAIFLWPKVVGPENPSPHAILWYRIVVMTVYILTSVIYAILMSQNWEDAK